MTKRRRFSPEFKVQVVLQTLRGEGSTAAICRQHGLSADLLTRWRQQFLSHAHQAFADPRRRSDEHVRIAELERLVGQLTLELSAAKKLSMLLTSHSRGNGR
jgi:transposase-like protein